ncbi:response regulator transcription factor [Neobacillus cucumis]|uniref:DNA-binding response regulator n=1 Tax=Neobacillus cucumis TaxID=1740721 RepID=A0A2N5HXX9_9BACI|nr:response regulator [Neobacillus cucumis]PLS10376.1 DNA-binding response regulator [Neobacillus cucumis]
MKVLIVDDEPLVRIGIKSSINWSEYGMELAGEAADGEEALTLMAETNPDIVFLDIKMPKKDGIQVLKEMKDRKLPSKVIILSSFDDLQTVKQAMKLGAEDYFHKPSMNEQEIVQVLLKIKQEIEFEQDEKEIKGTDGAVTKETILRQLLLGNTEELKQTNLKENNLYTVIFKVKNYQKVVQRYPDDHPGFLQKTVLNLLNELFSKEKEAEFLQIENNLFCVFFSFSVIRSNQLSFTSVFEKVQFIQHSLTRFLNIETTYGISEKINRPAGIPKAFNQAGKALNQSFYQPEDSIFFYQESDTDNVLEQVDTFIIKLKKELLEENYENFTEILTNLEKYLLSKKTLGESEVRKIYEGLLFIIEETEDYLGSSGRLEEIETFEELSSYYHELIQQKFSVRSKLKTQGYSPIIKNILLYLDKNYQQPISLNSLSEELNVSPNYISRLFKKEVQKGLFDYLNELRIERAKKLLKDYKYKIYEIAELVGFKSQVHFAIVFNKYVGVSPKDYRKE